MSAEVESLRERLANPDSDVEMAKVWVEVLTEREGLRKEVESLRTAHGAAVAALSVALGERDRLTDDIRDLANDWFDPEAEEWRNSAGFVDPEVWTIGNQEDSARIVEAVSLNDRARELRSLLDVAGDDREDGQ